MKMHQKGNAADSPPMETNKLLDTQKSSKKKEKKIIRASCQANQVN